MRAVQRLHEAALPTPLPALEGGAPAFLVVAEAPVPVFFAEALLGAERVVLHVEDKLVELGDGRRRALLWVGAVEQLVPYQPAGGPGMAMPAGALVAGWAAAPLALPVLDAERLLELAERFAPAGDGASGGTA
jgi:hypothetical protein